MNLKNLAKTLSNHINKEFQESKAQVLDKNSELRLTASKYLPLPQHLNEALGTPGLPFGQITQAYGKKDSGKSSLLMQAIASCQSNNILPILILTEPKFDVERLETYMGGSREEMIAIPVENIEEGFTIMEKLLVDIQEGFITIENAEGEEVKLELGDADVFFFWDSIGGSTSESELNNDIADHDKDMGRFAKALKSMTKRIWQKLRKVSNQAGILVLNQVWDARSMNNVVTTKPYGGEAVQHYYAMELFLKRKKPITMTLAGNINTGIGYEIELRVEKNHLSPIKRRTGFDVVASGIIPTSERANFKKKHLKDLQQHVTKSSSNDKKKKAKS